MAKIPDLKNIPKVDMKTINRYLSPRAMNDLNSFIEKLPQNAGNTILIAAAICWVFTAALGLFTTLKAQDLNNLRAQLQDAKALMPVVPVIAAVPVDSKTISDMAKRMSDTYSNLDIRVEGGKLIISGAQTNLFSPFREAVLQVNNGGPGWKVDVDKLCVGRECKQKQLSITLKIAKMNINRPESSPVSYQLDDIKDKPGTIKESK